MAHSGLLQHTGLIQQTLATDTGLLPLTAHIYFRQHTLASYSTLASDSKHRPLIEHTGLSQNSTASRSTLGHITGHRQQRLASHRHTNLSQHMTTDKRLSLHTLCSYFIHWPLTADKGQFSLYTASSLSSALQSSSLLICSVSPSNVTQSQVPQILAVASFPPKLTK